MPIFGNHSQHFQCCVVLRKYTDRKLWYYYHLKKVFFNHQVKQIETGVLTVKTKIVVGKNCWFISTPLYGNHQATSVSFHPYLFYSGIISAQTATASHLHLDVFQFYVIHTVRRHRAENNNIITIPIICGFFCVVLGVCKKIKRKWEIIL